jgi:hypothetical protein
MMGTPSLIPYAQVHVDPDYPQGPTTSRRHCHSIDAHLQNRYLGDGDSAKGSSAQQERRKKRKENKKAR